MERFSAQVKVLQNTSDSIKLRLSSDIAASGFITHDVNLYNEPLTLVTQVPWTNVTVTQGSSSKTYTVNNGEVMYEALPNVGTTNRGDIVLQQSNVLSVDSASNVNIPNDINLEQNYPNPFNPATIIKYQIPELSFITLKVYDVLGNEIVTLVNEVKSPGNYSINFDGSNLTSGVYFYQLRSGSPKGQAFVQTKKMILLQ